MRPADREYNAALKTILTQGTAKPTRMENKIDTISYSGLQMRFDLRDGFPLLEYKSVPFRVICVELAWFLSGRTNVKWLQERKCNIWNDDVGKAKERGFDYEVGELGPVYGKQWRDFNGIDQVRNLICDIKIQAHSRRLIVSAWNPADIARMVLPPCHMLWQIVANPDTKCMDMVLSMRSGDMGLGLPFNIASYAALLQIIANECDFTACQLVVTIGDAHIYKDHVDDLFERFRDMESNPSPSTLPPITVDLPKTIADFIFAHENDVNFKVLVSGYSPQTKMPLNLHT